MKKEITCIWQNEIYTRDATTTSSTGILFDTQAQIDEFFQQQLVYKTTNQQRICLAKSDFDLEKEDTLNQNLNFKNIDLEKLGQYYQSHPTLYFDKKVKTYTHFEKSLARILYAAVDADVIFIDMIYELLDITECQKIKQEILALQKSQGIIIAQILSHQVQGKYCDNLMAISMDGERLLPLKEGNKQ